MKNFFRRLWNEVGIYKAQHPLIRGMWFAGGRQFVRRPPTEEERFLLSLSLVGKTVYDVGANVGIMTLFFARSVGDSGKVVAFEPHPYSYHRLNRNLRVNRLANVVSLQCAVGDTATTLDLFQPSRHLSAATFDREKAENLKEGALIVHHVEVDSLDSLIARYQLPLPDMVKVDVEGFEVHVLRGAHETIQRCYPDWFIEIHRNINEEPTTPQIVEMLTTYSYRFYHVETQSVVTQETASSIRGGHIFAQFEGKSGAV
ncbi:MAG: hypothetical protein KatS3mg023_1210 [Armatimonadota bacterium]|nr:MAG: hypothetical protein KatS3mg023_1210 [Armatimonadota bacterium]